jgi:prevent-host-death family protein
MKAAKVSELKAGLSKYLARVKRGEEVLVTERGTPIAKLVPLASTSGVGSGWDRVRRLERDGRLIVRGTGRVPDRFWELPAPEVPEGSLVSAVIEEREERR